jgi:hypothetical protein
MSTTLITTFSDKGYDTYAKYFMDSLVKYLDDNVKVVVYTDKPMFEETGNWSNPILADSCPGLVEFKKRNASKPVPEGTKGFMKDAVRFSHKSYCIIHAARNCTTDQLIWLDADTEVLKHISEEYLRSHLPEGKFVSYLGRPDRYTETGWLQFDMTNPHTKEFFDLWEWYYTTDEVYNLDGQLDCHVFDACRETLEAQGKITGESISPPNTGKAHFDLRFDGYMCHYKGERKENRDVYFAKALQKKKKIR